jgi:hypothetical protein
MSGSKRVLVCKHGIIRAVYDDALLAIPGERRITRASHVEPARGGRGWEVRFTKARLNGRHRGRRCGSFLTRAIALSYEVGFLENHLAETK